MADYSILKPVHIEPINIGNALARVDQSRAMDIRERSLALDESRQQQSMKLQMEEHIGKMDDRKRAALKQRTEDTARVAAWADTPEKWDAGVDELSRTYPDMAQFKGKFSPERRQYAINQAQSVADILGKTPEGFSRTGAGLAPIPGGPADPAYIRSKTPPDNQLVEVYDESSPTGTRMVPRAQAVNQPGKPPSGFGIELDPNTGRVTKVSQGRQPTSATGADPGLAKPSVNKIEEAIIGNVARMDRVARIEQAFNPEFLQWTGDQGQIANWFRGIKEKGGANLDADSERKLHAFTTFRARAYEDLVSTLKEMSGAAVTPQEAERLLKIMGDPSNDSPTEFRAKMQQVTASIRQAQTRLFHMRAQGMKAENLGGIPLHEMPAIIDRRGGEIERELKAANPQITTDEMRRTVKSRLAQEFGLGG